MVGNCTRNVYSKSCRGRLVIRANRIMLDDQKTGVRVRVWADNCFPSSSISDPLRWPLILLVSGDCPWTEGVWRGTDNLCLVQQWEKSCSCWYNCTVHMSLWYGAIPYAVHRKYFDLETFYIFLRVFFFLQKINKIVSTLYFLQAESCACRNQN